MLDLNNVAGIYRVPFMSVVEMKKRSMKRGIEGPDEGIFKIKKHSLPHSKVAFFSSSFFIYSVEIALAKEK